MLEIKKRSNKALAIAVLFITTVTAAVLLLPLIVFAADGLSIDINYGYNNKAKGGRYLPLNITCENADQDVFNGNLSIYTKESDDKVYEYKNSICIAAGDSKEDTYYIPVGIRATGLYLRLADAGDNTIIEREINLHIDTNNPRLFIGILSDTPEKLDYLNDVSVNYGLLRSETFILDTQSFPENTKGLDMLDVIVISNYTIRDLNEAQSHALMDWVRQGGVLLLGTGERADDTLGRYAPELLNDMYEEPELCAIELVKGPAVSEIDGGMAEVYCVDMSIRGGNIIEQDNNLTLLASVNKENGIIVVSAYDFADVNEFAKTNATFASDLLGKCLGSSLLDRLAAEPYGNDNTTYNNVADLISTGDIKRIPPIGIYAVSIVAFILLAGPVLYLFMKQRSLTSFYRIGVILVSLGCTFIIFLVGSRTRFDDPFYNFATIIDTDEATVEETTYLNIRNPYNKEYTVNLDGTYEVYPVVRSSQSGEIDQVWQELPEAAITIARSDSSVNLRIGEMGAFTPQFFSLKKYVSNDLGEGFVGDINLYGNKLSGEITNCCEYDLTDVSMIFFGKVVYIGNIKANETKSLNELKVINVPLSSSEETAKLLTSDEEKQNTIAFYRDTFMLGYSTDVKILGFKAEDKDMADALVGNAELDGRGLTLIAANLTVEDREDDRVYRSTLIKEPTTISGEYNSLYNTMDATEPCLLEYQLGNDIEVESLVIEWAEPSKFTNLFSGSVAFYNYYTGGYDKIDTSKNIFDMTQLDSYLSPSNTITVRYTYEGDNKDDMVSLPMLSVSGYY